MARITEVTASGRGAAAKQLSLLPMFASLHSDEPSPTDPTATIVNMSGQYALPVAWEQNGSVLTNSMPIQFSGISSNAQVHWVALSSDNRAMAILFYGQLEEGTESSPQWDVFIIPARTIELIVA